MGIQVSVTAPGSYCTGDQSRGFTHARKILYQLSYALSLSFVQCLPLSQVGSQAILTHTTQSRKACSLTTCLAALLTQILINSQIGEF